MRHGCNILVAPAYKTMAGSTSAESMGINLPLLATWRRGVVVSTPDRHSGDVGSSPAGATFFSEKNV